MRRKKAVSSYVYNHRHRRKPNWVFWAILVALPVSAVLYVWSSNTPGVLSPLLPAAPALATRPGDVIGEDSVQTLTVAEATVLARQNFGAAAPVINTGVTKIIFHYRSELPTGDYITVYGRAYLPSYPAKDLPIFAFAPGTTGIGDKCAASLEQPKVANWANYDSHLVAYASQGFATVTTDYEGMRDDSRIHHYMVGELEGRAMLDSVRALKHLSETRGRLNGKQVFLGGYSQGGQAAFWADKLAAQYAPDITPKGVVGFGPVMSVKQTLVDVIHGANINWFGPYVNYSYRDYYGDDLGQVLLPKWSTNLARDVNAHCIDTDIPFWGHSPAGVYTPDFLSAATSGTLASAFPALNADLDRNEVGPLSTTSAKLLNQGAQDNVVLPAQAQAAAPVLCQSSKGPVVLKIYPSANHYNTMVHSFRDTIAWMHTLITGGSVSSTCGQPSTPVPTLSPTPVATPSPSPAVN